MKTPTRRANPKERATEKGSTCMAQSVARARVELFQLQDQGVSNLVPQSCLNLQQAVDLRKTRHSDAQDLCAGRRTTLWLALSL
jgi:hypothetical protein